jgi:lipopolysaccharide/colanic/teichoic acid biosynthesis glycosyltransferase
MLMRIIDFFFSLSLLIVIVPLLIIPIIFIFKIQGLKSFFFIQKRVGKNFHFFKIYKISTMVEYSELSGTITGKNDSRILPFGNFLRKTKINELPQLINILKGDMSFVGPRPLTREVFSLYNKEVQKIISTVKPGLTGMGSIYFSQEEDFLTQKSYSERNIFYKNIISPYKAALEIWYINNQSLYLNIKIMFVTFILFFINSKKIIHFFFKGLPQEPKKLKK